MTACHARRVWRKFQFKMRGVLEMKKQLSMGQLVRSAVLVGVVAALAAPLQAQNEPLEEIIVTGSHIKRNTFNYSTPITVIDEVEISNTGTTNLGDLLQTLPQSISTVNNANTAFSTTFSGLNLTDLRFLGTDRTLVLVNGRRFVSGAPPGGGYGVDLNTCRLVRPPKATRTRKTYQ